MNTSYLPVPKRPRRKVHTLIILLLRKQSDQGLACLLFGQAVLITNILFENKKSKVFEILEHLHYSVTIIQQDKNLYIRPAESIMYN